MRALILKLRGQGALSNQHIRILTLEAIMNNVIYIVGLVVVVLAVLAFFGLR